MIFGEIPYPSNYRDFPLTRPKYLSLARKGIRPAFAPSKTGQLSVVPYVEVDISEAERAIQKSLGVCSIAIPREIERLSRFMSLQVGVKWNEYCEKFRQEVPLKPSTIEKKKKLSTGFSFRKTKKGNYRPTFPKGRIPMIVPPQWITLPLHEFGGYARSIAQKATGHGLPRFWVNRRLDKIQIMTLDLSGLPFYYVFHEVGTKTMDKRDALTRSLKDVFNNWKRMIAEANLALIRPFYDYKFPTYHFFDPYHWAMALLPPLGTPYAIWGTLSDIHGWLTGALLDMRFEIYLQAYLMGKIGASRGVARRKMRRRIYYGR